MSKYKCDRCGIETNYRNNFRNHLNRKNTCIAKLKNISMREIKEKYGLLKVESKRYPNVIQKSSNVTLKSPQLKNAVTPKSPQLKNAVTPKSPQLKNTVTPKSPFLQNQIICEYCGKTFKFKQGKSRHLKNSCKFKKEEDNKEYWKELFERSEKEKLEKEREKEKEKRELLDRFENEKKNLMKQIEVLLTKVGNNNTTINQQIIIRNFGEENTSYLSDTFFRKLIMNGPYASIPKIVKRIHFNERHPENMNIKITNKDSSEISVFEENRWNIRDKDDTIKEIVGNNFNLIDNKYDNIKDRLEDVKQTNYNLYKNRVIGDNNVLKNIEKETKNLIMNNQ